MSPDAGREPPQPLVVTRCRELAARRDLPGLRRELDALLADLPVEQQPYVPTNLRRALDMFLDSYAGGPAPP